MEHIHIMSVGEHVHEGLPRALDEFKSSKMVLIVEEAVFSTPGPLKKREILKSMDSVREIALMLGKGFEVKRVKKISLDEIRDAVFEVVRQNQDARFYFNITHGTKVLSNGLFLMSIWLQGTAYYIDQTEGMQTLSIPKMPVDDLVDNPNYIAILDILYEERGRKLPYKVLFSRLGPRYLPKREADKKAKRSLQKGTFSKWVKDLNRWDLIQINFIEGSEKEKEVTLTSNGEFSLRFAMALRPKNREED
ncbi:MAG TPA: hypothetical protein HA232_04905 [Methanocellales archaeon]|nr:hypothetical protein [Methanocellales archaeon]